MCRQYLCFVCDRPLTEDGYFLRCFFNPDARPTWSEEWKSKPQCLQPTYLYSDVCHMPCNDMRVQAQAYIDRQMAIAAVGERSDGLLDWQRSPHESELKIPQVKALLLGQRPRNIQVDHPKNAREAVTVPTVYAMHADIPSTSAAVEENPSTFPAFQAVPPLSPAASDATGAPIPAISVAPNVLKTSRNSVRRACDRCRYVSLSHFCLLPSLPSDCGIPLTRIERVIKDAMNHYRPAVDARCVRCNAPVIQPVKNEHPPRSGGGSIQEGRQRILEILERDLGPMRGHQPCPRPWVSVQRPATHMAKVAHRP